MSSSIALRRSPKPGVDPSDLEAAAQLVHHEGGERLALDVLGNDDERLARLHHRFQQRKQLLQSCKLLFVNEDIWVFHVHPHLVALVNQAGEM